MEINELKSKLEKFIEEETYSIECKENNKVINEVISFLKDDKNVYEDLSFLLSPLNKELSPSYDYYVSLFLDCLNISDLLDIILNQNISILNQYHYLNIWNKLEYELKINYLENKKIYTDLDIFLINNSLNDKFTGCKLFTEIKSNNNIFCKISDNTFNVNYNLGFAKLIDFCDNRNSILSKESYSFYLQKSINSFDEFIELLEKNPKIMNNIEKNSMIFDSQDNDKIYNYANTNVNIIGVINKDFLNLFSLKEINSFSKLDNLTSDTYSSILQKLFEYNHEDANNIFSINNLKKCSNHSIDINPFEFLNDELRKNIFNDYEVFKKFSDTIMVEAIISYHKEDEILNWLRNDIFINEISVYALNLLINNMSFKSCFNMLQRKIIYDKIEHLNIRIEEKDLLFIKGFLDSVSLISKTDHTMLFQMINLLDKKDVSYYLLLPYIYKHLNNFEIVKLICDKEIDLNSLLSSSLWLNKLLTMDIVNIINSIWEKKIDLSIFYNKQLAQRVLNIPDSLIDEIDFSQVNYLFETIKMKSILSEQLSKITVQTYKSVLNTYIILGVDKTLELVCEGNRSLSLNEVNKLKKNIIEEEMDEFRDNHSAILNNITNRIISKLNRYSTLKINEFSLLLKNDIYLNNIISLMAKANYDSYLNIINEFYNYQRYKNDNLDYSIIELSNYINDFVQWFLDNQYEKLCFSFDEMILKRFKAKEKVLYSKRKDFGNEFLLELGLKVLIQTIYTDNYQHLSNLYKDGIDINKIKQKYSNYLSKNIHLDDVITHILIPITNKRFDKENCLNQLGIKKPVNYIKYCQFINDRNLISKINKKLDKYKLRYNDEEIISMMNYICYNTDLNIEINTKIINELKELQEDVYNIMGEVYIDKYNLNIFSNVYLDIYNLDEVIEYYKYNEIIDEIISKTNNFIKKNIDFKKLQIYYGSEYFKHLNTFDCTLPINNKNYELKYRVLSLNDIEKLFGDYDLFYYKKDNDLINLIVSNNNYIKYIEGYYDNLVPSFSSIMTNWLDIKKIDNKNRIDIYNLLNANKKLISMTLKDNILAKNLDFKTINSVLEDDYYIINDVNKRIKYLIDLYKESFKQVSMSVPYIDIKHDIYEIKIVDKYSEEALYNPYAPYKIAMLGHDFIHYSILNKNGFKVNIYKNNELIATTLGIRNGNTVFLNGLYGIKDSKYEKLLKILANRILDETSNSLEEINFVTIVNNETFTSSNDFILDSTICPIIHDPVSRDYIDYDLFSYNNNLLDNGIFYTNYDGSSTILASNKVIDKCNFKSYNPSIIYKRERNKYKKYSNNLDEKLINKIKLIISLSEKKEVLNLDKIDSIYLGDDFVIEVFNNNSIKKYILPYDDRAIDEIKEIENLIKE